METMEPEESTGGAPAARLDTPDLPAPDLPAPDVPAAGEAEPDDLVVEAGDPDPGELEPDEAEAELVAPPVVAVVVTTGAGPYLDATLASLAGQEYPALSVLVLDNAAEVDAGPRIAAALPAAYVRRLPENVGFAAAANEALGSVEGATFLLFCHDDVVLDPDTVRVLVEEAYRSNAAIVGPKLVDYDDPGVLLEVGMAVDHYGVPFSAIEPGEIDQEQHDGVRDVFFVSHATMLVRADLFRELGGFDAATSPGSDDIDLCWRARLVGARVLVAPAGRVRHRRATEIDERRLRRQSARAVRDATRARVRVLCKSYSGVALVWVLPSAFVLTVTEAVVLALTRSWRQAGAELAGWLPARGAVSDMARARAATQELRTVDDGDVRDLMVRGSARVRAMLVQRLHARDRLADVSSRARVRMSTARSRLGRTPAVLAVTVVVLLAFGSRALVLQRVPEVGAFRAWPGIGDLWRTFTAPWRTTMLGSRTPATPAFALMAALSTIVVGHAALARTIVVAGAIPLGVWGAYRVGRTLAAPGLAAIVAAAAYAANPVGRDAVAHGDLGPLVCYALAPFVLDVLARVAGDPAGAWRRHVHAVLVVGLLGAVAGSVWPPAILLAALFAVAFVLAAAFGGAVRVALRTAGVALAGGVLGALLLAPWSSSLPGADAATLGLGVRPPLSAGDVLRFEVGPARAGWVMLGLVVAALVPLAIASGARLVWATRSWVLVVASMLLAWLPGRLSSTHPVPSPAGVLVPAALGLALASGLGVAALLEEMRRARFGLRQLAAVAAAVGIALPLLALAADSASGRWQLPSSDWPASVTWMQDTPSTGGFRVLWVGDPSVLPADAKVAAGVGFALTRDGAGDVRASFAASETRADRLVGRALAEVGAGASDRLGHLLAPAGVRYVAVLERPGPGHGRVAAGSPVVADAISRQLDLSISRIDDGGVVYSNDAWLPRRAVVPAGTEVTAAAGGELAATVAGAAPSVAHGVAGPLHGSAPTGPGTVLWSEAADSRWHASAAGAALARADAFGWTNAFTAPAHAPVRIHFDAGMLPGLLIALETLGWLVVAALAFHTRARRAGAPVTTGDVTTGEVTTGDVTTGDGA